MTFSCPFRASPLVMARCAANSDPLSVVMVFRRVLYGNNNLTADGVHLPVPEAFAVGLRGPFVYACAAGDVGRLGRTLPPCTASVLQFMEHMPGQFPRLVGMDVVVNGLLANAYAHLSEHAGYLGWRPVLLYHAVDTPPQLFRLAVVALQTVPAAVTFGLRLFPYIAASGFALRLTSRQTVDTETPISFAMRVLLHFLFSPR